MLLLIGNADVVVADVVVAAVVEVF